jgi:6-phosphogluconolactonase
MEGQRVSDGEGGGAPRQEPRVNGGGGSGVAGGGPRRREVRVVEDAVELTRAAAAEVAAALALRRDAFPSIALAGGSTPRALYRLLADPAAPYRARIDWQAVHFFWGDERHVPPDHPDSNFRMAREAMLDHVQVPAEHVHRIAGEEPDAARAARLYERGLIEVFGLRRDHGNGKDATGGESAAAGDADARAAGTAGPAADAAREWPRFDLVLLGLGEDGHTASLFPGSPLLAVDGPRRRPRRLAAAVWVEKLDTWRITLTPPVLDHAATVIFLVSGAAKAPALAAVLEGEWRPELYPAQVVAPVDGRLLWLVDRAAAAQLRSPS